MKRPEFGFVAPAPRTALRFLQEVLTFGGCWTLAAMKPFEHGQLASFFLAEVTELLFHDLLAAPLARDALCVVRMIQEPLLKPQHPQTLQDE